MAIIMRLVNTHIHYTLWPFYLGVFVFFTIFSTLIICPEAFHFDCYTLQNLSYFACASIAGYFGVQPHVYLLIVKKITKMMYH